MPHSTAKPPSVATVPDQAATKPCHRSNPFTSLEERKWLHDRSEGDVHKLIVDTYRLRMADQHRSNDKISKANIHRGAEQAATINDFHSFIATSLGLDHDRKEAKQIFPSWWTAMVQHRCYKFAEADEFSNICKPVTREEIQEHYKDELMPMQMRVFSEQIDGYNSGYLPAQGFARLQSSKEKGYDDYVISIERWEQMNFNFI